MSQDLDKLVQKQSMSKGDSRVKPKWFCPVKFLYSEMPFSNFIKTPCQLIKWWN